METVVLVFILFVELIIAGILININTGQTDKGIAAYEAWDSKIEYVDSYVSNSYHRYNGLLLDYFEVCALVASAQGDDTCVVDYPEINFVSNRNNYISKKYLCDVVKEDYGLHRTIVTFREVQE